MSLGAYTKLRTVQPLVVESWIDKHLKEWIQPQMLRAPEVILGAEWDHKVDIWNVGLIVRAPLRL